MRRILANARGVHSPSVITRITFGVMDIERRAIPYLSYAYPIMRFQSDSNQVPMRFQWRQGADRRQVIGILYDYKDHCAAEPRFRRKVRGERLKAGSFYRFALNFVWCRV